MYPADLKDIKSTEVRSRISIERRIVTSLVDEFLAQGFTLIVDDGEEHTPAATKAAAMDALLNTDEDQLGIVDKEGDTIGWIKLVYGNDGWDVMSDWHTNLDEFMPKTLALVDTLS